jgi:GNAT superfamily N-acetyltransferase
MPVSHGSNMAEVNIDLSQLIVRDAMHEDLDALNAIRPMGVLHADRIRGSAPDRYRYLLAGMNDEIIGMVMLYFRPEMGWDRQHQMPLMMDLFVIPAMRSHGIGAAMVTAVEEFALVKGYGHLYLRVEPERNPRAFALYKRLGFQALQSTPYEDWHHFVDSSGKVQEGVEWVVDMRKWLA